MTVRVQAWPSMHALRKLLSLGRAQQPSVIAMLVGALLAVPILIVDGATALDAHYPPLPLSLIAVMILDLIAGPWVALGAAALTLIEVVMFDGSWVESAQLAAAVVAAELLRHGLRAIFVTIFLMLVTLGMGVTAANGALPDLESATATLMQTSGAVAAAALAMLVIPRRSQHFPSRCRIQWELVLYALVVGMASIASYTLVFDAEQSPRLFGLMLLAHVVAFEVARRFQLLSHDQDGKLRQWLFQTSGAESARPHDRMPPGVTAQLLDLARETRRLKRLADRHERESASARQSLQRQVRELTETQRSLRQTTAVLARLSRAHAVLQERWSSVVDQASDAVLIADSGGRIQYANRAVVRLLGMEPARLVDSSLEQLVPPHRMLSHPFNLVANGGAKRGESNKAPVRCADGKDRELDIRIQPFVAAGATEHAIHLRVADRMKDALGAIKRAKMAVDHARRTRNSFNAAMSHELRTPLHGLIATLDMLRDETLTPEGSHRLSIAKTSARSLLKIANDILDLSRMEGGDFTLERHSFSLALVVQEAVEEFRAQANLGGLQLTTRLHGTFPPALLGDRQRIRQIVVNLISNALKFTHEGGVRVDARFDGEQCTIDVTDTGEGVPEEQREAIFEPFVQAHTATKHLGAGLGLSICRRLSVAMGGSLVLLRTGPTGSTFRLVLPLEIADEPPPEDTSLRIFNNPRGRILVVEDHPANQYVVQSMLDVLTCPATIAGSGMEALELVAQQEFDLILMDCQLPQMDGCETTRRLRSILKRHVPIIAMTANAMQEERKRCLDAGMDDFLPKPFGRSELNGVLCKWLEPQKERDLGGSINEILQSLPAIESEIFDDLWRNLQWRPSHMRRIGETFLASLHDTEDMLDRADRTALKRQFHTLLGTSGMIGARQIERLAAELQVAAKAGRWEELDALRGPLHDAITEFERDFERRINSRPAAQSLSLALSD